jgi:acetyl-CoA carboxylase/biotin carboxylase 1
MQTHSKELQQVLDIVVSHQALQLKCALVVRLLYALVTPRPEHYRPLLRRLAALVGKHLLTARLCASGSMGISGNLKPVPLQALAT